VMAGERVNVNNEAINRQCRRKEVLSWGSQSIL
jgi:hypothetical protein